MGRPIKSLKTKSLLALAVAMLMALAMPMVVFAVDPATPDELTVNSVKVVRNIAVTGDVLVAFEYTIHYDGTHPTTLANKLFNFRLMAADGLTLLGVCKPYAFNDSGYGMGYSAFYFEPGSTPTWGTALVLIISGSPQYWSSPPVVNYVFPLSAYSPSTSKSDNQKVLGDWIVTVSRDLEEDWAVKLLTETDKSIIFNANGASYGNGTIIGLQTFVPKIFNSQAQEIDTSRRDWNTDESDSWLTQWQGTLIGDALISLQDLFSVSWQVLTSLLTMVIIVILFIWGFASHQDNSAAMIAGGHVLAGSTAMGFFHPALLAVTVLVYALVTGFIVIGDKS